ncbi:hypothetical protein D0Z07_1025 [Hyphodiscus hymeniophilus]|uniref:Uncharacterized protein n=1 Tax=Hyphodiscus hymeniophilus TaxID=353542 RepID=A0A9P6VQA2_9HELO|nr:hypothetical protein D0Z07_1025 [Hyphodiscus hymeniophilus]
MDIAYNQHSPHARHTSRSSSNLNHLTLAPLTSRFPLIDTDLPQEPSHHVSYIEGRSAPTTPSILAHSSRVSLRKPSTASLPKSKSSTHLLPTRQPRSGATTPLGTKRKHFAKDNLNLDTLSGKDRNDSDWLLRAGAAISSSTRESKGQAWLVSRASSTSLTAERDEEEEELQKELAREREQTSRKGSRRGSAAGAFDADDECSPVTTRRSLSFGPSTGIASRPMSRFGSRANSMRGSRAQLLTPISAGGQQEGYFDRRDFAQEFITEPDFVDTEDDGDEGEDEAKKDEAVVRKLARASNLGLGGLVERMLGWSLFAVDEDGEETEVEITDEKGEDSEISSRTSRLNLRGVETPIEDKMPPLKDDETGGWQDAAWLLSVATKVLL